MLQSLSGKTHKVITGVCVYKNHRTVSFSETTEVEFDTFTPEFIDSYIKSGSPLDKAGAYGIQDDMLKPFTKRLSGSLDNVIGLPICRLKKFL
jgi:septum formation protein